MNRSFAIAAALALGSALPALAQEYPAKQVRVVLPVSYTHLTLPTN